MIILIAPDKFKGSVTSFGVAAAIQKGLNAYTQLNTLCFPFADGGDGFAAVMKHYLQTATIYCGAVDPLGRPIEASYEWDRHNKTAIIEMAVASGLVLLNEKEQNPLKTSTQGTGLMIKHAIDKGARKIILGLGGSATNDAGMGILSALNFRFTDNENKLLPASGENLLYVKNILPPLEMPQLAFEIACDVQNTMHGQQGAAYIYAPQKGATKEQVVQLDKGLENFAGVIKKQTGRDVSNIPGTGAAGGIAAGLMVYFTVTLSKGVELVANASKIKEQLANADLLVTGEGKIDHQSNEGKVTGYMASLAKQYGIPCVAICGSSSLDEAAAAAMGIKKIIVLASDEGDKQFAIDNGAELIEKKAPLCLHFLQTQQRDTTGM